MQGSAQPPTLPWGHSGSPASLSLGERGARSTQLLGCTQPAGTLGHPAAAAATINFIIIIVIILQCSRLC